MAEFNPEAKDGDGDGIVQEGTEFERPIEELEVNPVEDAPVVEDVKPVEVKDDESVISAPKPEASEPALSSVEDGVIGTGVKKAAKPTAKKTQKAASQPESVAIYSERNVTWPGVGKVYRGFNIVSKEEADQWLTRSHCRLATPEEIRELKN